MQLIVSILNVLGYAFAGLLIGDFMSGVFHWWEDRYGKTTWPIIGRIVVQANVEHHRYPTNTCRRSYLYRNRETMVVCLPIAAAFAYFGYYAVALGWVVLSHGNEIHSWAHQRMNPAIRFFQRLGVLCSPTHHAVHHHQPYSQQYCVITNYVNPILAALDFWRVLERVVFLVFRVPVNVERATA